MTPGIRLDVVVLDAEDPGRLADFYASLLDGEVVERDDAWCEIAVPGGMRLAVQRDPGHQAPRWPDGPPQQLHLDLAVADISAAHARALALGARRLGAEDVTGVRRPEHGFAVYADPAGHPFCLCW